MASRESRRSDARAAYAGCVLGTRACARTRLARAGEVGASVGRVYKLAVVLSPNDWPSLSRDASTKHMAPAEMRWTSLMMCAAISIACGSRSRVCRHETHTTTQRPFLKEPASARTASHA
jgi:hypothetical protein